MSRRLHEPARTDGPRMIAKPATITSRGPAGGRATTPKEGYRLTHKLKTLDNLLAQDGVDISVEESERIIEEGV